MSQPAEIAGFIASVVDWSWLGNAIDPAYPLPFNGLSFTIVFASLISLSFFLRPRSELLYWQIFLLACLAGTIFPQLYLFAVHHLGFGLSRIQLLSGGIIPGFVLSAYTVDALARGKVMSVSLWGVEVCLPSALLALVATFAWRIITSKWRQSPPARF